MIRCHHDHYMINQSDIQYSIAVIILYENGLIFKNLSIKIAYFSP